MLRVTLELLPGNGGGRRRTLGTIDIANVTGGLEELADYAVTLDGSIRRGVVLKGARRGGSSWALVARALAALGLDKG